MRRADRALWPTKRRKRIQRRRQAARLAEVERPPTTEDMALALVMRGLASPLVLSPRGLRMLHDALLEEAKSAA